MERNTLIEVLEHAEGVSGAHARYEVAAGHRLTFYIGRAGGAMEVTEVEHCELGERFVALRSNEKQRVVYVEYDAIVAFADRTLKEQTERAGFA